MKKNHFKNRFLMFLTTLAMAFSVGVSLNAKAPVATKADIIPAGEKLYLKVNDQWKTENARFAANFFNSGGLDDNEWADAKRVLYADDLYVVDIPVGTFDTYIMCRMDPATTTNEWGNKWNQTANIPYDATTTLTRITDWDAGVQEAYVASEHINPAIAGDTVLYFRPDASYFAEGYDHLAAYFFVGGENQFVNLVAHQTGVYKVTAPTPAAPGGWEKVIFVSLKSATNAWEVDGLTNVLKQTPDLIYDGTKDMYDTTLGAWKTLGSLVSQTPTTAGISSEKVRIWVNRGGHYATEGYQYLLKAGDVHYTATGYEKALVTDDVYFAYFDVPLSALTGKNVDLVIVDTNLYFQVAVAGGPYAAQDNSKLWVVKQNMDETYSVTKGAVEGRIYNTFFAKVLEGYLTCSTSADNGYEAFNLVDTNFLPRAGEHWDMQGDLGGEHGVKIADYTSEEDYATGVREATPATDAYAKYIMMKSLYDAAHPSPEQFRINKVANNNIIYVLVIGMLFAIAAFGFVRFRKKANVA